MAKCRHAGLAACVALVASFVALQRALPRGAKRIPRHMLQNEATVIPDLLSEQDSSALMGLMKELGDLPSNVADTKYYTARREHVGEAVPLAVGASCPHPFMVPSVNRSECVLAGRIDIGRHYLTTGGLEAIKEPYEAAVSRLQSFGAYLFDTAKYPIAGRLFESEAFQAGAKKTCPAGKQHIEPFQLNLIVQVPGQSVATHVDGVYFLGATRFDFPQWLLAAMKFSGLFEDRFVDQVQVVAYYHEWVPDESTAGEFVYWTGDEEHRLAPIPRQGSAVDGTKVVHGASVYRPNEAPPRIDKSRENSLRYRAAGDVWDVVSDGETLASYPTSALRCSVVYRARCFADAAEESRYHEFLDKASHGLGADEGGSLSLDQVLGTLQAELERRRGGSLPPDISRLNLAIALLDEFIRYPYPSSFVPLNYCSLARLAPWVEPLLRPFCGT